MTRLCFAIRSLFVIGKSKQMIAIEDPSPLGRLPCADNAESVAAGFANRRAELIRAQLIRKACACYVLELRQILAWECKRGVRLFRRADFVGHFVCFDHTLCVRIPVRWDGDALLWSFDASFLFFPIKWYFGTI